MKKIKTNDKNTKANIIKNIIKKIKLKLKLKLENTAQKITISRKNLLKQKKSKTKDADLEKRLTQNIK